MVKIIRNAFAAWSGGLKDGRGSITLESGAMKEYPFATGRKTQSSSFRLTLNIVSLKGANGSLYTAWLSPGGSFSAPTTAPWLVGLLLSGAMSCAEAVAAKDNATSNETAAMARDTNRLPIRFPCFLINASVLISANQSSLGRAVHPNIARLP